jgi:hypothetical protein
VRGAMTDALWMWVRDGQSDTRLFYDNSVCGSGAENGGWFPHNGTNEIWYESANLVNSSAMCGSSSAAACTPLQVGACAWPGLHTDIFEFHMVVANDFPQQVVNQNALAECLSTGHDIENLFLHELGHAYGIGHDDAVMNSMHIAQQDARNCHVAQGFSVFPFPDDTAGLMAHNDASPSTAQFNATGTAWYLMSGASMTDVPTITVPASGTLTIPSFHVTIESMYSYPWTFFVSFVVVNDSSIPTFNWSANAWVYTSVSTSAPITAPNWTQQVATLPVPSWTLPVTALTRGARYRVWGHVWSGNAETDSGDNVFPTSIVFTRS